MAGAPNLKLRITVEDELPAALERDAALLRKAQTEINAGAVKAEKAKTEITEEGEKERLAKAKINYAAHASATKAANQAADQQALDRARSQLKIEQASASARSNLFERQKMGEEALTKFNKEQLRFRVKDQEFQDELIEQERLRHEVKMIAIAKREAEYSSQPFQKLLTELATLSGLGGFKAKAAEGIEGIFEHSGGGVSHPVDRMTNLAGGAGVAEQQELALATRETEAAFAAEGAAIGATSSGLAKYGGVLLGVTAAVGVLGLAFEHTVEMAKEDRLAEEQLAQALKDSGRAIPIDLMDEYAESLMHVSRFHKDAIQGAEAVILGIRGLSSTELPKLIQLSADLASSPGFNGTLKDAAIALAKAFEEPEKGARALRSAQIVLSDSELKLLKDLEDTGEKAKAQAMVFDMLTAKTKGFAEETTHSLDVAGNAWHEFEGKFGNIALRIGDIFANGFGFGGQKNNDVAVLKADIEKQGKAANDSWITIAAKKDMIDQMAWDNQEEKLHAMAESVRRHNERETQELLSQADKTTGVLKNRTEKQQDLYDKYQSELTAATEAGENVRLSAIEDGAARARAAENKRYRDEMNGSVADKAGKALAEKAHIQLLQNISDEAAQKSKEKTERDETAYTAHLKAAHDKEVQDLHKQREETAQAKAFDSSLSGRAAALDPLDGEAARAALLDKQRLEKEDLENKLDNDKLSIEAREHYFAAITRLEGIHAKETTELDRKLWAAKKKRGEEEMDFGLQIAGNAAQILQIVGMKGKALFAIQQGVALATIAVKTQEAVVADNAAPFGAMEWKIPWDYALGASSAAVVAATTVKGFEDGGWTGGREGQPMGIVHGQERVVSASEVRAAGGPAAVDRAIAGTGGGGDSFHFHVAMPLGTPTAEIRRVGQALTAGARDESRNQKLVTRKAVRLKTQV